MSRGYNKVILMGNVVRDPDVRMTQSLLKVVRFTVACGREWKDKTTGEKRSDCDFIQCQALGALADVVDRYVRKGKGVMVEGRLRVSKYTDKNGVDKWATDVLVENMLLLGSKGDGEGNIGQMTEAAPLASTEAAAAGEEDFPLDFAGASDVDIPF